MTLIHLMSRFQRLAVVGRWSRLYSTAPASSKPVKAKAIQSMTPAGTKLKGLNIKKNAEDPVALPEEEYPPWLWEILDKEAQERKLQENPDLAARKLRRKNNKKKIKENNFLASMK
jgi:large subunit ribosomal protein L54